jgi:quinol monooxygenase YgiN
MAITRINEFHAAPGRADALHAFLASVLSLIRGADGCRSVELFVGYDDAAHLAIIEVWDSVEAHKAAASRVPPAKLAEVLPLLAEPPKGRYYHNA